MSRREQLRIGELEVKKIVVDRGDGKSELKNLEALVGDIQYDVTTPFTVSLGIAPAGSKLVEIIADVETAFDAGTTNVLVVGSSADDDAYAAAGDIDETSATMQRVAGNLAEFAADTEIFAKYTQTGTAASAGLAHITAVLAH